MKMMMMLLAALMVAGPCNAGAADYWTRRGFSIGSKKEDEATITRPGVGWWVRQDMTKPPAIGVNEEMRIGERVFPNVRFGPVRGRLVHVFWQDGSEWMKACALPEAVQTRLGFDRKELAAEAQAIADAKSAAEAARKEKEEAAAREAAADPVQQFTGKVVTVTKEGMIVESINQATSLETEIFLSGHPGLADAVDGDALKFSAMRNGRYSFVTTAGAKRTVARWVFVAEPTAQR